MLWCHGHFDVDGEKDVTGVDTLESLMVFSSCGYGSVRLAGLAYARMHAWMNCFSSA